MNVRLLADKKQMQRHAQDVVSGVLWQGSHFVTGGEMAELFAGVSKIPEAQRLCSGLTGRFNWVRIHPDSVWLAVDHLQSMPLFYSVDGDTVHIGSTPGQIADTMEDAPLDPVIAAEYLVLGYVTGRQTLVRNIRQVEPGTLVEISRNPDGDGLSANVHAYMDYVHTYRDASREQFSRSLGDIVDQTMDRAIRYADGRPIILPLSGGYDSRLIALSLARMEYPDVHCISYGKQGSPEMQLSRQIAEELGFRWTGVHYTPDLWRKWFHSDERRRYYRDASREARIPNIQELVAFGELKAGGLMPGDGVVMSGHLGDALVGGKGLYDSYTYREHPETSAETILRHVLHYNYYLWDWSGHAGRLGPWFRQRILSDIGDPDKYPDSPSACEMWNIRERQARFIIPVARLYEFFGYDYWMPFCDQDYMRFWLTVPLAYRHDKGLYTSYIDGLSQLRASVHQPEKPVLKLREAIRSTPVFRPARALYQYWQKSRRLKHEYDRHPMAWYGILEQDEFKALFTGRENINSFQSLELLRTLMENGYLSPELILSRAAASLDGE
jgi:asparagine synthase (glutamine-hydrolysing)